MNDSVPPQPVQPPPGPSPSDLDPWNAPPLSQRFVAGRRAAIWVWSVAAIEILIAGCCVTMLMGVLALPDAELEQLLTEQGYSQEQVSQVKQVKTVVPAMAIGAATLGLVPAIVQAGLGFGVRRGHRVMITIGLIITITQALVAGWLLLLVISAALQTGQPGEMTFGVIVLGTLIGVLINTARLLLMARQATNASISDWGDEQR